MLKAEGIGKNIEKAIEDALFQLRAPREDCDIKIIEEGGLFKKAKVIVEISDDCKEKYQPKQEKKSVCEKIATEEETAKIAEPTKIAETQITTETTCTIEDVDQDDETTEDVQEDKRIVSENAPAYAKEFIEKTYALCGVQAQCDATIQGSEIRANISSANPSEVIGKRGDMLNALQFLTSIVLDKTAEVEVKPRRVIIDAENYRGRREQALQNLANKTAKRVLQSRRPASLEPMPAQERRIIHMALQNFQGIQTYSKGNEPHRYLIVAPAE